jgi:tetratricopeptide (TPR) repeat protein
MADQSLNLEERIFTIDLHGVKTREATRAITIRISECFKYGLVALKCCYGTPDRFDGSILQALSVLLLDHEHVQKVELPDWVFRLEQETTYPPLLVIPIVFNKHPKLLGEDTVFEKFSADYEMDSGQRLLCEIPYQPFRKLYDWSYAARAIKRGCTVANLKSMCASLEIGNPEEGLSIRDLMSAANSWKSWKARGNVKKSSAKLTEVPPITAQGPVQFPAFYELSKAPDVSSLLRAFDRLVEEGEYVRAQAAIDKALLFDSTELAHEVYLRQGQLFFRQNDDRCESWILRADALIKQTLGADSPHRIRSLEMLIRWYSQTGEPERILEYANAMGKIDVSRDRLSSPSKRFINEVAVASVLREAGSFGESIVRINQAIWSHALQQSNGCPSEFTFPLNKLQNSMIPTSLLIRAHLFCAQNYRDLGDYESTRLYLDTAEALTSKHERFATLLSEIMQLRGNLYRKLGYPERALECYTRAIKLNNSSAVPSENLAYELNLSCGVAHRVKNNFISAEKHYDKASQLAERLPVKNSPHYSRLLISYATLRLCQKRFEEAIKYSQEAVDLLQLKAPNRHSDLARVLLYWGQALNGLGRFQEAVSRLELAESHAKKQTLEDLPSAISMELERAKLNGKPPVRQLVPRFLQKQPRVPQIVQHDLIVQRLKLFAKGLTDDGLFDANKLTSAEIERLTILAKLTGDLE